MASPQSIANWTRECDILICGYGLAAASAAIEAHDLDPQAQLLIVEKAPAGHAGGNSRVSGQSLMIANDVEALMSYQRQMNSANPIPEAQLQSWAEAMVALEPWVRARADEADARFIYGTGFSDRGTVLEYPEYGAEAAVAHTATILPLPSGVWTAFARNVARRDVDILYEAPVVDLVQDPDTLEVFGAIVAIEGRRQAVRARRGVILAMGGYENNLTMQRDYFGLSEAYAMGTPYNTGDGIHLLQKAGADLWHMRNKGQSGGLWPALRMPGRDTVYLRNIFMQSFSWLDIAADGERFYNETADLRRTHYKEFKHGHYLDVPLAQVLPVTMILDERTRRHNCLVTRPFTWNAVVDSYQWSEDNSAEVAQGWIAQADSISELALLCGRDPLQLSRAVNDYNAACAAGIDAAYHRDPATLQPISEGPFYAVDIVPGIVCTGGGGRRNSAGEVLTPSGDAIPGLFEAGELGSIFSNLYQNGCYLTEAMISGRSAARSALTRRS